MIIINLNKYNECIKINILHDLLKCSLKIHCLKLSKLLNVLRCLLNPLQILTPLYAKQRRPVPKRQRGILRLFTELAQK